MPRMMILTKEEAVEFDQPPKLSGQQRKMLFQLPAYLTDFVNRTNNSNNRIILVLSFVYFKARKKFYHPGSFHQKDIKYTCSKLKISYSTNMKLEFSRSTFLRYKILILNFLGFRQFDDEARQMLINESTSMIKSKLRPKLIFINLIEKLLSIKIDIPSYNQIANLIIEQINLHNSAMTNLISQKLTCSSQYLLDQLLKMNNKSATQTKIMRYKLTLLKKIGHSTKPGKIKKSINDFILIRELFNEIKFLIPELSLAHEGIKYYATQVIKSKVFQIDRRKDDNKYLYLICFIIHQYYKYQDVLVDVLIKSTNSMENKAFHQYELYDYETKKRISNGV